MSSTDIGILKLAQARMAWAANRQQVLAQNVANASTPGYTPRDVAPFQAALAQAGAPMERTSPLHLPGAASPSAARAVRPSERSPDGNAVSLDRELMKVADTASTQDLAVSLHRKYQGMVRLALGRGGM